jgi:hypothetical protein
VQTGGTTPRRSFEVLAIFMLLYLDDRQLDGRL